MHARRSAGAQVDQRVQTLEKRRRPIYLAEIEPPSFQASSFPRYTTNELSQLIFALLSVVHDKLTTARIVKLKQNPKLQSPGKNCLLWDLECCTPNPSTAKGDSCKTLNFSTPPALIPR